METVYTNSKWKTSRLVWMGVFAALSGLILVITAVPSVKQCLDKYAIEMMTARYGSKLLAGPQEGMILQIAKEMGINESIVIRKMNTAALQTFGYNNAFACWALLGGFLPFSNQPFMFLSEGFLEDLSPEEQRFLIGHELIHIRDRHVMFFNLVWAIAVLLLLTLAYFGQRFVRSRFALKPAIFYILMAICVYCSLAIPNLIGLAYRRWMERAADLESFRLLNSHEGCLKIITRWQNDFQIPKHDAYWGLLSDHPSCFERENYCLQHQESTKNIK